MAAMLQFMRLLTPCVLLIAGMAGPLPGAMAAVSPADKIKQWFSNFAVTKDDTGTEGLTSWPAMKLICIDDNLFRVRTTFLKHCSNMSQTGHCSHPLLRLMYGTITAVM